MVAGQILHCQLEYPLLAFLVTPTENATYVRLVTNSVLTKLAFHGFQMVVCASTQNRLCVPPGHAELANVVAIKEK